MSKLRENMTKVHENTDFKVEFAGVTQLGEFRYTHGGSVQPGLEYHIHYTNDKKEVYMTGGIHNSSSKIIERISTQSSFQRYTRLKPSSKSQYPRKHTPLPNDSDYNIGEISRYFCQKSNDTNSELFEVSIDDYDKQNNLFRYFEITWRISGKKSEVIRDNQRLIDSISIIRGNEQLRKILFPLQYWSPPKGSIDDIQRKLGRLKNTLVIPEVIPEQQSDTNNNPLDNPRTDDEYADFDDIVRDENGNPVIGFTDGTRVDLTESGP